MSHMDDDCPAFILTYNQLMVFARKSNLIDSLKFACTIAGTQVNGVVSLLFRSYACCASYLQAIFYHPNLTKESRTPSYATYKKNGSSYFMIRLGGRRWDDNF